MQELGDYTSGLRGNCRSGNTVSCQKRNADSRAVNDARHTSTGEDTSARMVLWLSLWAYASAAHRMKLSPLTQRQEKALREIRADADRPRILGSDSRSHLDSHCCSAMTVLLERTQSEAGQRLSLPNQYSNGVPDVGISSHIRVDDQLFAASPKIYRVSHPSAIGTRHSRLV
jgi:hypothetical protein